MFKWHKNNILLTYSFVFVVVAIITGGYFFIQFQKKVIKEGKMHELKAIGILKKEQILNWRSERLAEALFLFNNISFTNLVQRAVASGKDSEQAKYQIQNWLASLQKNHGYVSILLIDNKGKSIVSVFSPRAGRIEKEEKSILLKVKDHKNVFFTDIVKSDSGKTYLNTVAPIFNDYTHQLGGVVIFRINPHTELFEIIKNLSISSSTAEVLIGKPSGDSVIYINSLRHKKNVPLSYAVSLQQKEVLIVQTANGKRGIAEGYDYRGKPVIGYVDILPEMNWLIVVKIDKSEIFTEVNQSSLLIILIVLLIIFSVVLVFMYLLKTQKAKDIENLYNAEQKRRLLLTKYENLLMQANDVILLLNENEIIIEANKRATEVYGYTNKELIGMPIQKLRSTPHHEKIQKVLKNIPLSEGFIYQARHVTKEGKELTVEISSKTIYIDQQFYLQSIIRNISERLKMEEKLLHFGRIIEGSLNEIYVYDASGLKFIQANKGALSNIGYTMDELRNMTPLDIKPSLTPLFFESLITPLRNGEKEIIVFETEHLRKNGSKYPVEVHLQYFPFESQKLFVAIILDITERREAEQKILHMNADLENRVKERTIQLEKLNQILKEKNIEAIKDSKLIKKYAEELEDLYQKAPCGYHSLDANGLFVKVNDTELKWLGYTSEEIEGKLKFTDIITEKSKETFYRTFPVFKQKGFIDELEFEMIRKDGTIFPVLLSATAISDTDGNFLTSRSSIFDITELKKAQKESDRYLARLETANKEIEAFSYTVSHDLRAPLRHINGFIDILKETALDKLEEKEKTYFEHITHAAKKMSTLIDELLSFSRISRSEIHRTNISFVQIVQDCLNDFSEEIRNRKINLTVGKLPEINADPAMMKQAMENLLSNAIKYTGKVENPRIEIGSEQQEDHTVVFVKDNGAGFDMKYYDKLFGVFQRLHTTTEFEGIGIGLANVKRIISKHGGKVWATAEQNKGATFYFWIPKE